MSSTSSVAIFNFKGSSVLHFNLPPLSFFGEYIGSTMARSMSQVRSIFSKLGFLSAAYGETVSQLTQWSNPDTSVSIESTFDLLIVNRFAALNTYAFHVDSSKHAFQSRRQVGVGAGFDQKCWVPVHTPRQLNWTQLCVFRDQ